MSRGDRGALLHRPERLDRAHAQRLVLAGDRGFEHRGNPLVLERGERPDGGFAHARIEVRDRLDQERHDRPCRP